VALDSLVAPIGRYEKRLRETVTIRYYIRDYHLCFVETMRGLVVSPIYTWYLTEDDPD